MSAPMLAGSNHPCPKCGEAGAWWHARFPSGWECDDAPQEGARIDLECPCGAWAYSTTGSDGGLRGMGWEQDETGTWWCPFCVEDGATLALPKQSATDPCACTPTTLCPIHDARLEQMMAEVPIDPPELDDHWRPFWYDSEECE